MGKLSVRGVAKRDAAYDGVEMRFAFHGSAGTTGEALRTVTEQSEAFLEKLTAMGVNMKEIHCGDLGTDYRMTGETVRMQATREITVRMKLELAFVNRVLDLIREQEAQADVSCDYFLTDPKALHDELLKEAWEDARRQALFITQATGQQLVGVDSVQCAQKRGFSALLCEQNARFAKSGGSLLDELSAPLTTEEESIDVVWLIE